MQMRQWIAALAFVVVTPLDLAAQEEPAAEPIGTPLLGEAAFPLGLVTGGRWVRPQVSLYLAASWVGFAQRQGHRLGLAAATTDIRGPLPTDPSLGMVKSRHFGSLTVERIRLRTRGPWVLTTGYGAGIGSGGYTIDQSRSADTARYVGIDSWAPAISGSVDIALRVPRRISSGAHPFDFYVGVRSTLLFGAPRVDDVVPATGSIPTARGIMALHQLTIGARRGLFGDGFSGNSEPENGSIPKNRRSLQPK